MSIIIWNKAINNRLKPISCKCSAFLAHFPSPFAANRHSIERNKCIRIAIQNGKQFNTKFNSLITRLQNN